MKISKFPLQVEVTIWDRYEKNICT